MIIDIPGKQLVNAYFMALFLVSCYHSCYLDDSMKRGILNNDRWIIPARKKGAKHPLLLGV
jgi:hypothetical protein